MIDPDAGDVERSLQAAPLGLYCPLSQILFAQTCILAQYEHKKRLSRSGGCFNWSGIECPERGWTRGEWAANGRYGLIKGGRDEPEADGRSGGGGAMS